LKLIEFIPKSEKLEALNTCCEEPQQNLT